MHANQMTHVPQNPSITGASRGLIQIFIGIRKDDFQKYKNTRNPRNYIRKKHYTTQEYDRMKFI